MVIILSLLFLFTSCGHLSDVAPSYRDANYYSTHFQSEGVNYWGIAPLKPNKVVTLKLFHRGTIQQFSRVCNINQSNRFEGDFSLTTPNCDGDIELTILPDNWGRLEHGITEKGRILISQEKETAIQIPEGKLTLGQFHIVDHESDSGIMTVDSTCGQVFEREYYARTSHLYLSELCSSSERINSFSVIFRSLPFDAPDTRVSKLSVFFYSAKLVPLDIIIPRKHGDKWELSIPPYVLATSVNGKIYINRKNISFKSNDAIITWITATGRKSVTVIEKGVIKWHN